MSKATKVLNMINETINESMICNNFRIIEKKDGTFNLQSSQWGTDSDYVDSSKQPFKTIKTLKSIKDCLKFAKFINPGQHKPIQVIKLDGSKDLATP